MRSFIFLHELIGSLPLLAWQEHLGLFEESDTAALICQPTDKLPKMAFLKKILQKLVILFHETKHKVQKQIRHFWNYRNYSVFFFIFKLPQLYPLAQNPVEKLHPVQRSDGNTAVAVSLVSEVGSQQPSSVRTQDVLISL